MAVPKALRRAAPVGGPAASLVASVIREGGNGLSGKIMPQRHVP
jgi:hypothetical protein